MAWPNDLDEFTAIVDATSGVPGSGTDINSAVLTEHIDALEALQITLGLDTDDALLGGYDDLAAYLTARFVTLLDLDTDFLVEHAEDGTHGNTKKLRCEVVADAAARGGISSPREGDLVWQSDTDTLYVYDGAAWDVVPGASHASLHERAGSDEVDGDHLDIDFTPTNYVPATTPAEAANVDDLTAHLYGVDITLGKYKTFTRFIPASDMRPSTTNGCAAKATTEYDTNDVDIDTLDFDKDADEFAQWTGVLDNWDGGTILGKFYWTFGAGGSAAETVTWKLQGRAYEDDDALDQAWGDAVVRADIAIAIGDVHISTFTGACTLAGSPVDRQLVQLRVWRDVSEDDLACDAMLIGVLIRYTRSLS